ncbi:MAG: hypothetical protein IT377_31200 [Polyangiaceae bacterium]|nr:hypothetical protein [Polyangiaceae bacterium]
MQLRSLPAFAIDAAGTRRAVDVQLDTSGSEPVMIAQLDTLGLSYPITVAPTWVSGGACAWPSEALVGLRAGVGWGYFGPDDLAPAAARLDRLLACLWKLTH